MDNDSVQFCDFRKKPTQKEERTKTEKSEKTNLFLNIMNIDE